jgi:hypothetical protein
MKSLFRHKILTLLAGIATAMVIIFSQLFYFQAATYCQEKADTEQHDQKTEAPESYISIPSSTISSTSHIEINQDLNFVLEILFEREPDEENITPVSLSVNRFFQTLFTFIISPNAP